MINALLKGIFSLVLGLVNVLLTPIDLAINSALPSLASAFDSVNSLFSVINSSVGYVMDLSGLSATARTLIVIYYGFILTIPLTFSSIKLALKWYNNLKP